MLTDEADDPISLHNNKHSRKKEAIDLEVDKVVVDKVGCTKKSNNTKEIPQKAAPEARSLRTLQVWNDFLAMRWQAAAGQRSRSNS